ncbi:MAG TPA: glucose-6-phosphate dehydrogenase [Elusimicrobiales bacterium]|nr:glucose-6-phosphate dehydrogenase [Elusimicrobiales bacterium]
MPEKYTAAFCDVRKPSPCGIVIFGASGHLANKKIIPSLFSLYEKNFLSENFFIAGCARTNMTDDNFRAKVKQNLKEKFGIKPSKLVNSFLKKLSYTFGNYDTKKFYADIYKKIVPNLAKTNGNLIIYLSTPALLFKTIVGRLKGTKIVTPMHEQSLVRIIIEKPFGKDMADALEVDRSMRDMFLERQIYRIDHYLGKETVQNILMFRFANILFEPAWNHRYIDNVQVRVLENVGIENRFGYFEHTGTLLDMFQNHVLRLLTLIAMEAPSSVGSDQLRQERVNVFKSLRMPDEFCLKNNIVRAQYLQGKVDGKKTLGYRNEEGVSKTSNAETFFAAKLFIDNQRWKGVPFYVETGKRLSKKMTRITVTFKKVQNLVFSNFITGDISPNVLTFDIEPNEGLSLKIQTKNPSLVNCLEMQTMDFNYSKKMKQDLPDAYERLLLDCMLGDQTLFARSESIAIAWNMVTPILKCWRSDPDTNPLRFYPSGSSGPKEAETLLLRDGRKWH